MTASSLQRAVQEANDAVKTKTTSPLSQRHTAEDGGFESCFASGLDLSEFASGRGGVASTVPAGDSAGVDTSSSPSSWVSSPSCQPVESASAQLLRRRGLERERRIEQDAAEDEMRRVVQKRLAALHNTSSIAPSSSVGMSASMDHPSSSSEPSHGGSALCHVADALVRMHGTDREDVPSHKSMRKVKRQQLKRPTDGFRRTASGVAKKSPSGVAKKTPPAAKKTKRRKY